jgi:hypothetical protein
MSRQPKDATPIFAETKWLHAAGHKARKGVQELTIRGAVGEREGADGVL